MKPKRFYEGQKLVYVSLEEDGGPGKYHDVGSGKIYSLNELPPGMPIEHQVYTLLEYDHYCQKTNEWMISLVEANQMYVFSEKNFVPLEEFLEQVSIEDLKEEAVSGVFLV